MPGKALSQGRVQAAPNERRDAPTELARSVETSAWRLQPFGWVSKEQLGGGQEQKRSKYFEAPSTAVLKVTEVNGMLSCLGCAVS